MTYEYRTKPFDHQREVFEASCELQSYALFWEQGTGKTKTLIDTIAALYLEDKIDAVLVVAPNGVHRNWINDEIPVHLQEAILKKAHLFIYQSQKSGTKWHQKAVKYATSYRDGLTVFTISYNGFMTKKGKVACWNLLKNRRCLYILDESHHVKTPKAKRTRSIITSGKYAPYRRIATGTPVSNSPFDVYSQLRFINPHIWEPLGIRNFAAFKQYFGVWFTAEQCKRELGWDPGFDKLIEYKNLDILEQIVASVGNRVLKEDVLDLPAKLYTKRFFELSKEQRDAYDQLKSEYMYEWKSGDVTTADLAITRLLRFQQITCGYLPHDMSDSEVTMFPKNPRLEVLEEELEGLNHQAIVWSRFTNDINIIIDMLGEDKCARYDGQISDDECEENKQAFKAGDKQWFVGNQMKGAEGLTLNEAKSTHYYTNSFRLTDRLQSEDRPHRIGQDGIPVEGEEGNHVLYTDYLSDAPICGHLVTNLRGKVNVAAQVTGDKLKEWI